MRRTLLVAMLVVGAFFGEIKFERQRHQPPGRLGHRFVGTTFFSAGLLMVDTGSATRE